MTIKLMGERPALLEEALTCAMGAIAAEAENLRNLGLNDCADILMRKHEKMNQLRYELAKAENN